MLHDRLYAHLSDQIGVLNSPEFAELAGELLVKEIALRTPRDTGTLAENLLVRSQPRRTGDGWAIGVGNRDKLGNPNRAPRHTISQFKAWVIEAIKAKRLPKSTFKRWFGHPPSDSRYAWWVLPREAKESLQAGRERSYFGGGYQGIATGKSAYFYPQEGSQPEWAASAATAGITPQRFVDYSLEVWREVHVPSVIQKLMSRMRHPEY